MSGQRQGRFLLMVCVAILIAVFGYYGLTAPDRRSAGDKIGDAVNALPDGVDKAARQLESRTPGEKIGDAVQDTGHDIKRTFNNEQQH